jgi:hypothetical protein
MAPVLSIGNEFHIAKESSRDNVFVTAGLTGVEGFVLPGGAFNGAPTAISHLCPGFPCAGFIPAAGVRLFWEIMGGGICVARLPAGCGVTGKSFDVAGKDAETGNGSPTAISHL